MNLRTNTSISALTIIVALLTLTSSNARAGEAGAHQVAPKKVPAAAPGPQDKPAAKTKREDAPAQRQRPAEQENNTHEAANDGGVANVFDAAIAEGSSPRGDKLTQELPPPTRVDEPPPARGEARRPRVEHGDPQPPFAQDPPLLERLGDSLMLSAVGLGCMLVLLAAAAAALAVYALRRCRSLTETLAEELRTAHARMENLAQKVVELERLTPALAGGVGLAPQPPAASKPTEERKPPSAAPARSLTKRMGSVSHADLPLLRLLLGALDRHGLINAAGTHVEVDIQHLDAAQAGIAAATDLAAQLSQLNFVSATSQVKAVREQNFLSIVPMRSGADNVPRQVVRVHQEAVPELRALALGET